MHFYMYQGEFTAMRINAILFTSQLLEISESSRNVMLGSVRPYPRSMIESISSTLPNVFAKTSTICHASQSLEGGGFFDRQKLNTEQSLKDSRFYLQALEYESRKDDMRVAFEMRQAWASSILAELKGIQEGLIKRGSEVDLDGRDVESFIPSVQASSTRPNPALDQTGGNNVIPEHLMRLGARQPADGPRLNTPAGWESLRVHHAGAKAQVEAVTGAIASLGTDSLTLLNEHIKFVATNTGYRLKWPSMMTEEMVSLTHGDAPEWDKDAKPFTPVNFAELDKQIAGLMKAASTSVETGSLPTPRTSSSSSDGPLFGASDSYKASSVQDTLESISNAVLEAPVPLGDTPAVSTADSSPLPAEPSFSRRMSALNAKLNWLNSLRLGNEDAQNSLLHLITEVRKKLGGLVTTIRGSLDAIKKGLTSIDSDENSIWKVYEDAEAFTHDATSDTPETRDFQAAIAQLSKAINLENHHASLPGRTRYIVGTLKIMHANLIALVDAHGETPPEPAGTADLELIKTTILKVATISGEKEAAPSTTVLDAVSGPFSKSPQIVPETLRSELAKLSANAKETSMCILYGHVDGAQVFSELTKPAEEKGAVADVCKNAQAYGQAVLKKKLEEFKPTTGGS
jgi:hypothetical protein